MKYALLSFVALAVLGGALLSACSGDDDDTTATATTTPATTASATATATSETTPSATATATEVAATPTATETAMAMATVEPSNEPGAIVGALLIVDTAHFHDMAGMLEDGSEIDPAWLGLTQHARAAVADVVWPSDLADTAQAFLDAVPDFEAALDDDDAETATEAVDATHDAADELLDSGFQYLETQTAVTDDSGAMLAAVALADGAGFQGMEETLNGDSPEIDPEWLGATKRARIAVALVAWPSELQAAASAFVEAAKELETALDADDASAAAEPAAATHEAGNELSHAAYEQFAGMQGSSSDVGAMLAALILLDRAGLHQMNLDLAAEGPAIDASWLGGLQRARAAVALVAWPDDVQADADDFLAKSEPLEAAIDAGNVDDAVAAITDAHVAHHVLIDAAYQYLGAAAMSMAGMSQ